jgi:hypothetical protein
MPMNTSNRPVRAARFTVLAIVVIGLYYAIAAGAGEPPGPAATVDLLFRVVIALAAVVTVGRIATPRMGNGERAQRAGSRAGLVLAVFVLAAIAWAALGGAVDPRTQICNPGAFAVAGHLLAIGLIASELVRAATLALAKGAITNA